MNESVRQYILSRLETTDNSQEKTYLVDALRNNSIDLEKYWRKLASTSICVTGYESGPDEEEILQGIEKFRKVAHERYGVGK